MNQPHTNWDKRIVTWGYLAIFLIVSACTDPSSNSIGQTKTRATEILQTDSSAVLMRQGSPYFIQGAGGQHHLTRLRACGGNSIRIWDDGDADRILNQAQRLGLTVMLGLWIEREIDGFDYYDQQAVARQYQRMQTIILKYRNHPALLMWCVGNEWSLRANNIRVFDEVNRIAAMIHKLDPNHPVSTAMMLTTARPIWLLRDRCPEIDILALNVYGGLSRTKQLLQESGWTKPYLFSEFGVQGHWESELTPWRTSIELTSQQKYVFVKNIYEQQIATRPPRCLGSYLFLWGTKEEGSHTWYGCFDEQGRETPIVELMQTMWGQQPPDNQAPVVTALLIDNQKATHRSFTVSDKEHRARVVARDPDNEPLTYTWEIRYDLDNSQSTFENTSPSVPLKKHIRLATNSEVVFDLPRRPGNYRLFANVYDNHNHVGTANLSFCIVPDEEQP